MAPETALGRRARRLLTCSVSFRWRGRQRFVITGRHMVFVGIGWKVIGVLCLLVFFILQTCQPQSAILGASARELPFFARMRYGLVMILMDGKAAAQKIFDVLKEQVAGMVKKPRLAVVVVGGDPVIASFISQKKKAADAIGAEVRIYPFPADITTNELRKRIAEIVHEKKNNAVIIQLPLPMHINKQYILNAIPPEKDADVLSARAIGNFATGKGVIMPPVAGAIKTLFEEYNIS
ncbi:MAG: tetrahydrofolate dehydrogenase/cyclohydrolase catalytic domain-containing protein, partial [Candidatus Sungiibacteriota bacterium]